MELSLFAAVFSDGKGASNGLAALRRFHEEGKIRLSASAVLARNEKGEVVTTEQETPGAPAAVLGGIVGGLLGLVGGPIVAGMAATAGALSGGWFDVNRAGERTRFRDVVAAELASGKAAVLAEAVRPDDSARAEIRARITALGGSVIS